MLRPIERREALRTALEQQQAEPVAQAQEPFEDLATELFVIAQTSPADDGFSDTIERIELWLREHFSTPPQRKPLTDEEIVEAVRVAARGSAIKRDGSTSQRIARAIEAAHGIKEGA